MGSEQLEKTPHVMFIPMPFQGHISPAIQLSKRLASRGVRVTIVATTQTIKPIEHNQINMEYINYDFVEGHEPNSPKEYMEHMENVVKTNLPLLLEKQTSRGYPVTVLVHDSLMPFVVELGHSLGLQVGQFFTQTCAVSAIYYHVFNGRIAVPPVEEFSICLPSLPELKIKELPSGLYDGLYPGSVDMMTSQFLQLEKADWIFFNTFDAIEDEIAKWMSSKWPRIKSIGPSIPSMYLDKRLKNDKDYGLSLFQNDDQSCIKWLDSKEDGSVVYVSFGSLANLSQDAMDELAWGLLNSNNNFLWVVRDTEQSKLPSHFVANTMGKGLVVSWCPQLQVLAHKAVGSFMTHCGWNSTVEALSLGVPMLVLPQWTDQTTNAKYVVDVWRTGVRIMALDKGEFTREEITECVNEVMEGAKGEELKVNATKWKELAIEAMVEGGSSYKNINDFISEIVSG